MKSMDVDIKYCKTWKRFYYKTEKVFASGFVDKSKIKGEQNYMRIFLKSFHYPILSVKGNVSLYQQK